MSLETKTKPHYIAKSSEEFKELEARTNTLLKHYEIDCIGGYLCSSPLSLGEEKIVKITPEKNGTIREVYPITDKPPGRFFRWSHNCVVFDIEDVRYMIEFKP